MSTRIKKIKWCSFLKKVSIWLFSVWPCRLFYAGHLDPGMMCSCSCTVMFLLSLCNEGVIWERECRVNLLISETLCPMSWLRAVQEQGGPEGGGCWEEVWWTKPRHKQRLRVRPVQRSRNTESLTWPTVASFKASFRLSTSIPFSDLLAPPCFFTLNW